jgi:hypothetical protein
MSIVGVTMQAIERYKVSSTGRLHRTGALLAARTLHCNGNCVCRSAADDNDAAGMGRACLEAVARKKYDARYF